jgi:hypothetical protein
MTDEINPGPMVVGHRQRYQNRIITRPEAFDPENDTSRIPDGTGESCDERLHLDRELYWFMIELGPPFTTDGESIARPGFTFSRTKRKTLADDAVNAKREDDPIKDMINLRVKTQGTGDLRTHGGTPVINLPYRASPEYTVPSFKNQPFSRKEMKLKEGYRPLPEEAVIGKQDDVVFVRIPYSPDDSVSEDDHAVYLLFDWISLNHLSDEQFGRLFQDNRDITHVTDAEIGRDLDQAVLKAYLNVSSRVLDEI